MRRGGDRGRDSGRMFMTTHRAMHPARHRCNASSRGHACRADTMQASRCSSLSRAFCRPSRGAGVPAACSPSSWGRRPACFFPASLAAVRLPPATQGVNRAACHLHAELPWKDQHQPRIDTRTPWRAGEFLMHSRARHQTSLPGRRKQRAAHRWPAACSSMNGDAETTKREAPRGQPLRAGQPLRKVKAPRASGRQLAP